MQPATQLACPSSPPSAVRRPLAYDLDAGIFKFDQGTEKETQLFRVSRADGPTLTTLDLMLVTPILEKVWDLRNQGRVKWKQVMHLVTHDAFKFFRLMLRKNGYVLEQLLSPLVVHTTPEHDELKSLVSVLH